MCLKLFANFEAGSTEITEIKNLCSLLGSLNGVIPNNQNIKPALRDLKVNKAVFTN